MSYVKKKVFFALEINGQVLDRYRKCGQRPVL